MSLQDEIEILATYLAAAEKTAARAPDIDHFDGCEPFTEGMVAGRESDEFPLDAPWDPNMDLPVMGVLRRGNWENPGRGDPVGYALIRVVAATPEQMRGFRYCRQAARISLANMTSDGDLEAGWASEPWGRVGGEWRCLDHRVGRAPQSANEIAQKFDMARVTWWRRIRSWRVLIGFGEGPRISFETSPTGAREVFKLRDVPNGRSRRVALRHWVSEHWRSRGLDDAVKVRKHLRGAVEFGWNGMRCAIVVPSEEREAELAAFLNSAAKPDARTVPK